MAKRGAGITPYLTNQQWIMICFHLVASALSPQLSLHLSHLLISLTWWSALSLLNWLSISSTRSFISLLQNIKHRDALELFSAHFIDQFDTHTCSKRIPTGTDRQENLYLVPNIIHRFLLGHPFTLIS